MNEADRLIETLRGVAGTPLVVLLTGHPDPDAIASALAHQRICSELGVPATIAYVHPISRSENRALVKLLEIEMVRIKSAAELERFALLSLVDTGYPEPSICLPKGLRLLTVVDHHLGIRSDAEFVDVRTNIGATSSIYAEYLEQAFSGFGQDARDTRIATALLIGIRTDTDDYLLATAADYSAGAFLRDFADDEMLRRLAARNVSSMTLDLLGRALQTVVLVRDYALAGVGFLPLIERDAIGFASDVILRRDDVETAIVYGVIEDRIEGSLRTKDPDLDPASFLERVFGTDSRGRPLGGGRRGKGGFRIPIDQADQSTNQHAVLQFADRFVKGRLQRAIENGKSGSASRA